MADIWNKRKRSEVMRLVRSRGNKATELRLVEIFKAHGISGWRRDQKLPGKPDFVFRKEGVCVFVDGCFWHSCPKHSSQPASNHAFWREKLARNQARDRQVNRELKAAGWRVIRIWQHDLAVRNQLFLANKIRERLNLQSEKT